MPQPIRQLVPGVAHWMSVHPNLGIDVSSYLLPEHGVLFDPLVPSDGLDWFEEHDAVPRDILLSCRHHLRDSQAFVERFGCAIHASEPGMHEFSAADGVTPFRFGDVLAGGVIAHEVDVISPDETAFEIPDARALLVADGVINHRGLRFVPDNLIGDDPEAVKAGLREAYGRLLEELDFDHLLCAHGEPIVGSGPAALHEFANA